MAVEPIAPPGPAIRWQRLALLIFCIALVLAGLNLFNAVLLPFVAAAGIAYLLDPLCTRLTRARLPRGLVAMLLIVGGIVAALLAALLLYPLVLAQLGTLVNRVPAYAQTFSTFAGRLVSQLQQQWGPEYVDAKLSEFISSQAGGILTFVANAIPRLVIGGVALFNLLSLTIVTPVVAYYLLRDWPSLLARIQTWIPPRYQATFTAQAREIDRILAAWLRGQALCCLLLALYYAIALSAAGLELGLVIGLAAGLLTIIPYVGSITGGVVAIGLAFAQFPTWNGVLRVLAVLLVGQILESYVIYPRFLGDRVELPAVWVIFALFAGGAAFGFLGVLLAVPVAATIGVIARFWLRRYMASPLYRDSV